MESKRAVNTTHPPSDRQRFFSLKWKALILFSLVLVTINVSFWALIYHNLMKHFEMQRDSVYGHYVHEIQALLDQSAHRLQQVGETIPLLSGMRVPLISGNRREIVNSFSNHWPLVQLTFGINLITFFDRTGGLVGHFGSPMIDPARAKQIEIWIGQVTKMERPLTVFYCSDNCNQYSLIPLLANKKNSGVILLESSIAEMVLNFKKSTGTDIGVLIEGLEQRKTDSDISKNIIPWNIKVAAMTGIEKNMHLLNRIAEEGAQIEELSSGVQTEFGGRSYNVRLLPISNFSNTGRSYWVIIDDITQAVEQIHTATNQSLFAGAFGLFISEALLLGILWSPMSRLRRIAKALPLLAQDSFSKVRSTIYEGQKEKITNDEIDVLDNTTISLSYELEHLKNQVQQRTNIIFLRMKELAVERDFVTAILNTAQVIILTFNKHGEMMLINQYGKILTGYSDDELKGRSFYSLFPSEESKAYTYRLIGELSKGQRDHVSHESVILCKDNTNCDIAWFHSRLSSGRPSGEPLILSIGLDITERKKAESCVSWMADHDPLTGLFNRRRFQAEFEKVFKETQLNGHCGALMFLDLDQFKYVNDTNGHPAGDRLLQAVAENLSSNIRDEDIIGRMGGDEFAIIIKHATARSAITTAQKLISGLNSIQFLLRENRLNLKVSASIGIVLFPLHGTMFFDLLANADLAMYQAKDSGRGRCHLFSDKDHVRERIQELVCWKDKIEKALDNKQFILYFQPIMDITSRDIYNYEVLLRMRDENGNIISPESFIMIAEQTGLIQSIDKMVLDESISCLKNLSVAGRNISLNVNISAKTFENKNFFPFIRERLCESGVAPDRLTLEITETAAVSDISTARNLMNDIKGLGCSFALDDFGVGFSSYNYLKQLPIDYVKISGSFVRQLSDNQDNQIFVKALAEVAKGFGKKTVAECVEDQETLTLLSGYQVNFVQGYHIGRPAEIKNFSLC